MQNDIHLPSGGQAYLYEVIGQGSDEVRLRYVSAKFDPSALEPEALLADMTFLCQNNALVLAGGSDAPQHVTVSLADRETEFGILNSDVSQSFEAFTIDRTTCIWEAF
ncbi:DUF6497 family protein [Roseovarius arcticus]|uniref:DUF6497 family protein n=1 Tax=Roseovarius arcticus TaxID=2547404 RepID=UPI0011106094|nr:DUF6497 family protein [Roseovarius arcticus]